MQSKTQDPKGSKVQLSVKAADFDTIDKYLVYLNLHHCKEILESIALPQSTSVVRSLGKLALKEMMDELEMRAEDIEQLLNAIFEH